MNYEYRTEGGTEIGPWKSESWLRELCRRELESHVANLSKCRCARSQRVEKGSRILKYCSQGVSNWRVPSVSITLNCVSPSCSSTCMSRLGSPFPLSPCSCRSTPFSTRPFRNSLSQPDIFVLRSNVSSSSPILSNGRWSVGAQDL